MAKYVKAPIVGASLTGDVAIVTLASFVGGTDMAYSIALDARRAGKRVGLLTATDFSYIDDWVDDENPELIVYDGVASNYEGKTVIVISDAKLTPEQLTYPGAAMVLGIMASSIVMNQDAFRLEQSDRALLCELEKLLPEDSPIRKLRAELRNRINT